MGYVLIRKTWRAGADPTEAPDETRTVFHSRHLEPAACRAEALASRYVASGQDGAGPSWWAKGRDALHRFEVAGADETRMFPRAEGTGSRFIN